MKKCLNCIYCNDAGDFCWKDSFTFELIKRLSLTNYRNYVAISVCSQYTPRPIEFILREEMVIT